VFFSIGYLGCNSVAQHSYSFYCIAFWRRHQSILLVHYQCSGKQAKPCVTYISDTNLNVYSGHCSIAHHHPCSTGAGDDTRLVDSRYCSTCSTYVYSIFKNYVGHNRWSQHGANTYSRTGWCTIVFYSITEGSRSVYGITVTWFKAGLLMYCNSIS
jgi:hypothetical protein